MTMPMRPPGLDYQAGEGPPPGLGGGPGGPGGPPPGLAEALAGLGGGGPPQAPDEAPPDEQAPTDTVEILKQMIDLAMQYQDVEDDDVDKANVAKILAQLQGMLATEQKEKESALGVSPAVKYLSKATARGRV